MAEIMDDFPELTEADISACLEFASDRKHHSYKWVLFIKERLQENLLFRIYHCVLQLWHL